MCIKSLESLTSKGLQQNEFLKKCRDGMLYESVLDKLEKSFFPSNWDYKSKRNHVKTLLLNQLFANPKDPKHHGLFAGANRQILASFETLYPEVAYVYRQIKEGNYKDLCSLFQRVESIAMQGFVCKRLQKEYPHIPIFTLHDCLITTEGNEEIIMKVMQEEIKAYIGYTPTMKQKRWSDYGELMPERNETANAA